VSDRPEDVDAAFAAIVADLEREGVGRRTPDLDEDLREDLADEPAGESSGPEATATARADSVEPAPMRPPQGTWRSHDGEWDWSWGTDEEHYVPPEPPPLPKLRPLTIVALALIVAAVALLVLPGVIGLDARIGTPIALVALTCGGAMLLLRVRQSPRDPEDRDDGAQI